MATVGGSFSNAHNSDPLVQAMMFGTASGLLLSTGVPVAGAWSFFRSAYHNRDDGLPRAISAAYQASRGVVRGVYDMSGWLMDYTGKRYPKENVYRDLGFAAGLGLPLLNAFTFYSGFKKFRAGSRNVGALLMVASAWTALQSIYSTMGMMKNLTSLAASGGFRTAGFAGNP